GFPPGEPLFVPSFEPPARLAHLSPPRPLQLLAQDAAEADAPAALPERVPPRGRRACARPPPGPPPPASRLSASTRMRPDSFRTIPRRRSRPHSAASTRAILLPRFRGSVRSPRALHHR